jgi:hypothetical protein
MHDQEPYVSKKLLLSLLAMSLLAASGCDNTPPPGRAFAPPPGSIGLVAVEPIKPLPPEALAQLQGGSVLPYEDEPLVVQEAPEEPRFLGAYYAVGRPRLAIFLNRTLTGDAAGEGEAEISTRRIDYDAVETILTDWLSCQGKVSIMSPMLVRSRLTPQQVSELSANQPAVPRQIAQQLDADVLIYVRALATKQSTDVVKLRIVAEALNIRDGLSIGRGVVDVPPPLEKQAINRYTRFLARKLMDNMTGTWLTPAPMGQPAPLPAPGPQGQVTPAPAPVPQGQVAPAPAPVPQEQVAPAPAVPMPAPATVPATAPAKAGA